MQLNYHWPCCGGMESSVTGGTVTSGEWHCVQWQFDGSGGSATRPAVNIAKVWLDGTQVIDLAPDAGKNWYFAPWNTMDFGFNHYQTSANTVDAYLDDFAIDGEMIPCE